MNTVPALAICGSNVCGDVAFSCALRRGDHVDSRCSAPAVRGDLAALVAELCAANGVVPAQLTELRLDVGPGSYTGLRVAVTFARFLQRFGSLTVLAIDSLALMARRAASPDGMRIRALLDARRGRYHHGVFVRDASGVAPLAASSALALPEVLAAIAPGDHVVLPGPLATQLGGELTARGAVLQTIATVVAEELFAPGLPFVSAGFADLEPRYLMTSYAED